MDYKFIKETLFFPKQGILVIGDLHLGYDYMLRQSGILIPERQISEIIERLEIIIKKIKSKKYRLKKIIFLGDLKHSFGFEYEEKDEFFQVLDFLKTKIPEENIILIKGNHDTFSYLGKDKMKEIYIEPESKIAFLHGHKQPLNLFDKEINLIVMGHIHPSVILEEKQGVKKETFKCFLAGKYKKKQILILPSFLNIIEGSAINNLDYENDKNFSIIPKKALMKFDIHVVGKNKTYNFGKVKDLN